MNEVLIISLFKYNYICISNLVELLPIVYTRENILGDRYFLISRKKHFTDVIGSAAPLY